MFLNIPRSTKRGKLVPLLSGFGNCVQYGSNVCGCSYSCKFVKEYYEDSKDLSEAERKLLNSSFAAKRKISAEQREKRKAEEAEVQAEMWKRIQMEIAMDKNPSKTDNNKETEEVEKQQMEVEEN